MEWKERNKKHPTGYNALLGVEWKYKHYYITRKSSSNKVCAKCRRDGEVVHHITYIPETTVVLCNDCHNNITFLNKITALFYIGRKLVNSDREYVYLFFLQNRSITTISVLRDLARAMNDYIIVSYLFRGYT